MCFKLVVGEKKGILRLQKGRGRKAFSVLHVRILLCFSLDGYFKQYLRMTFLHHHHHRIIVAGLFVSGKIDSRAGSRYFGAMTPFSI